MPDLFFEHMGHAIYNGGSSSFIPDTDAPICPECGATMKFHGDDYDLKIGDEFWECPNCDFAFDRHDIDPYILPNDD